MKYLLLTLLLLVPLFIISPNKTNSQTLSVVEYGCIARPDANGTWSLLDNTNHDPIGCSTVTQNSTSVTVNLSNCLTKVVTASADSDEGLLNIPVHSGLSMGLCSFVVYLYDQHGNSINPSSVTSTSSNVWLLVKGLD